MNLVVSAGKVRPLDTGQSGLFCCWSGTA